MQNTDTGFHITADSLTSESLAGINTFRKSVTNLELLSEILGGILDDP